MPSLSHQGTCEHCGAVFGFRLIHNGLNETAYAYCDTCGGAALLDTHREDRAGIPRYRAIDPQGEGLLAPCACGGTFAAMAKPRCPTCRAPLDAKNAAGYIETAITPVASGWKWQGDWRGLYCLIIDERVQLNPWRPGKMKKNPYQHIDLRVNDLEEAWVFYSKLLPAVGFEEGRRGELYSGYDAQGMPPEQAWFGFTEDKYHRANANRIAFWAESRQRVDDIGELLESAGARNISGPRECPEYTPTYYAVFFEDPFGNCLEVCYRED